MAMLWTNHMVMGCIIQTFSLLSCGSGLICLKKENEILPNHLSRKKYHILAQLFKKHFTKKKEMISALYTFQIHYIL